MAYLKGKIEAISAKEIPADNYGNTYRYGIRIGDDWYSMGTGKKPYIYVGSLGDQLNKGDEIEFMYETNGKYKNVNKKSITRTSVGSGQSAPAQQQSAQTSSDPNPAAVGQVINLALETGLVKSIDDLLDPVKAREAVKKVRAAKEVVASVWDKDLSPVQKPVQEAVQEDQFDDDIPF
jgi:hypothetical protein